MVNDFPKHIAVIIDGNRRWAKEKGMKPWKGHEEGAKTLNNCLGWAEELSVKEISVYALSTENLKRDPLELEFLFKIFKKWFGKLEKEERIKEKSIKIRFIGDLSLVPQDVRELAEKMEKETEEHENFIINFCFAYGGRLELIKAFNKLKGKKGEITEEDITKALWLSDEPDLIIRTGGAVRTSNFLPWQSAYSEWLFLEKMWPAFTKQDLIDAISEFKNRKRNFGK
jgi:tritrans,polycis-undecaprenyl-diphosphate synthase [geranylgeranyl-diphosphate specific]